MVDLTFQSDGKVRMNGIGDETLLDYTIDGSTVTVKTPRGATTLTIVDANTLQMPEGITLKRVK